MTLLQSLKRDIKIDWWGHHGVRHWARVRRNGRVIARHFPGVDLQVLDLFAVLHDCMRESEDEDWQHAERSGLRIERREFRLPGLSHHQQALLARAVSHHNNPAVSPRDITVAACWNADRLDLGRVGITPREDLLCAAALPPREVWWPLHLDATNERNKQRKFHEHADFLPT